MRVVIVDDEAPARRLLREYLGQVADVQIVAECENGFEAVKAVQEHAPDLLFLDVQMPKLDGFEVLELLEQPPAVVFTTAFDEYAIRAFDVHAVDYLLKPFSGERLAEAVQRVRDRGASPPPVAAKQLEDEARTVLGHRERIIVRDGSEIHVLPAVDIDYVEARDDQVCFVAGGRDYLKTDTLARVERQLDEQRFVRIHRSYLLNVERLSKVEPYSKDSKLAILRCGKKLPVSRAGYTRLRERM